MTQDENDRLKIEEFERRLAAALRRILQDEEKTLSEKEAGDRHARH